MTPREAMLLAIAEGRKGVGFVSPNPLVGCVILDNQLNLIGLGYHARLGEGHAEVEALRSIKDPAQLHGAHVYVTLEPCAHQGRTPSCARALAALPIASVTYGLVDPNPKVQGQGAEILRQSGKSVIHFSELQVELEELCEVFLCNMRARRAFVALKVASSLDGKIALPDGRSQWITNAASRAHVQRLRGSFDAVLIGNGTFFKDNPRLNSRDPQFATRRSRVVLLDPNAKCLPHLKTSALWSVRKPEDILLVTRKTVAVRGVDQLALDYEPDTGFSIAELTSELHARGIHSVFVEGGAQTYGQFLKSDLRQRLFLYLAPKILGEGLSWSSTLVSASLEQAVHLQQSRVEPLGGDFFVTGLIGRT